MPVVWLIVGVAAVGALLFVHERKATVPVNPPPPPVAISSPDANAIQIAQIEQTGITAATSTVGNALSSVSKSLPIIGAAVSAVEGIILAQHTARLNDAISENKLIPSVIEAFDADLAEIAQYYNEGEISAAQAVSALVAMDKSIYSTLRNNAQAKPGIAWNTNPAYSSSTAALVGSVALNPAYGAPCDKTCTVSCCVYYNDLRPAIFGRNVIGPGNSSPLAYAAYQSPSGSGLILGAIQAVMNADAGKGSQTVKVIPVSPPDDPAYGNYSRAGYSVVFTKPQSFLSSIGVSIA